MPNGPSMASILPCGAQGKHLAPLPEAQKMVCFYSRDAKLPRNATQVTDFQLRCGRPVLLGRRADDSFIEMGRTGP
jgi:hypothetical protein